VSPRYFMSEPNSEDTGFGSELRRRETPEHRRVRYRNGIRAALLGMLAGVVTLIVGIRAMLSGEMVPGHSNSGRSASIPMPGEWVALIGFLMLVLCIWVTWRIKTGKA
jgi:hypothetical protein